MTTSRILMTKGLETKHAALLVQEANRYASDIRIFAPKGQANMKSLMSVISIGILDGQEIDVSVKGLDEEAALEGVLGVLHSILPSGD